MSNLTFRSLLLAAFVISVPGAWRAAGATPSALDRDPSGWMNIQPSPDLSGWTRVAIPPSHPLGRAQWHVAGRRVLVCDGDGGHEMLRYDQPQTNCIFHVEFRFVPVHGPDPKYNSGVFVRNSADGTDWYQAQLAMDGGYLFGQGPVAGKPTRFHLRPTEQRMKPAGRWNVLEVSARGDTLQVWLNGAVTCTYRDCGRPWGYVALESEGYAIEFRNVKLKPL